MKIRGITDEPMDEKKKSKEIQKIINEHDRKYGLNLKHPKSADSAVQYGFLKREFTENLLDIMRDFNHLDDGSYDNPRLFVSEITNRGKTPKGMEIFQNSPLWNGRRDRVDIMDDMFKARFLVLLYSEMAKYIDDVVDMEFRRYGHKAIKDDERYLILKRIVQKTEEFHDAFVSCENSLPLALQLNAMLSSRSKKKRKKVADLIVDHVDIIQMNRNWLGRYTLEDDVLINDLVKMAYVVVTENPDISKTTPTKMGMDRDDKREIKKILTGLGEDILWYKHNHKKKKNPIFYEAFLYAYPYMPCSYSDINENTAIRIAVRALYYLSFLINDPKIHCLIEEIV